MINKAAPDLAGDLLGQVVNGKQRKIANLRNRAMEPGNLENLFEKVETIAHGPQADLLKKFVDLLYKPLSGRKLQESKKQGLNIAAIRPRSRAYR